MKNCVNTHWDMSTQLNTLVITATRGLGREGLQPLPTDSLQKPYPPPPIPHTFNLLQTFCPTSKHNIHMGKSSLTPLLHPQQRPCRGKTRSTIINGEQNPPLPSPPSFHPTSHPTAIYINPNSKMAIPSSGQLLPFLPSDNAPLRHAFPSTVHPIYHTFQLPMGLPHIPHKQERAESSGSDICHCWHARFTRHAARDILYENLAYVGKGPSVTQ